MPAKLMLAPVAVMIIASLIMGLAEDDSGPECTDGCSAIMLDRADEYACTGKVSDRDEDFRPYLEACRKKLDLRR